MCAEREFELYITEKILYWQDSVPKSGGRKGREKEEEVTKAERDTTTGGKCLRKKSRTSDFLSNVSPNTS